VGNDAYPAELERNVTLTGGEPIRVRPIRPTDAARLQAFHSRLSRDSIFFRFFSHVPELTDARAAYFTRVDYRSRMAIVAVRGSGEDEEIIGVIRYDILAPGRAEMAVIVEDRYQRHGVGAVLFRSLVAAARARGIQVLVADVLPTNVRMLRFLQESGIPSRLHRTRDYVEVELELAGPDAPVSA